MDREEKLISVFFLVALWTTIFFFLCFLFAGNAKLGKMAVAGELDSKCDVEGRIIQDTAYDAQLYVRFPMTTIWVPMGYFPKGAHLKEIETNGRNIICVFGDLTLAEGIFLSETNSEEGERIEIEYRILSGEREKLSLEMTGGLIRVLRTEGNKSVSKTYLINSQDGSAGIQGLFAYLRDGSADSHFVFFPFDNKLYSARFYHSPREDGFLYESIVSPVEKPLVEKVGKKNEGEAIKEVFLKVKDGKIIGAEAVFNKRLKVVLTQASE